MRDRQRKISFHGIMEAAAFLTVVFSVTTIFDSDLHFVELFSHFRLQYLVASILLLVLFVVLKNRRGVISMAVAIAINAYFVYPWYVSVDTRVNGTTFKLIHANVHASNTEHARLVDLIRQEQPDLFILQEVTTDWVDAIDVLREDYPYSLAEPLGSNFGIAAYSKIPFDTILHVDSPPMGYPTIVARIAVGGEFVTIVSTHPTIPVGKSFYDARNEQLDSITELVRRTPGRKILLGDLNASIWDPKFRQLEARTGMFNVRKGFGVLPTWPTFMPFAMIPIDHALVSHGIGVSDVRTGNSIGSDHLPLIVTLSL